MPNYDYRCEQCGMVFVKMVPISERDNVSCPQCHTKPVKRLITGGSFMKSGSSGSSCGTSSSGCGGRFT